MSFINKINKKEDSIILEKASIIAIYYTAD